MTLFRFAVATFAILLMVAGAIVTISPIPGGFIIVLAGLALFASAAPSVVRGVRRRWRWFDQLIHRAEKHLPEWLARRLRGSDYVHDDEKEAAVASDKSHSAGSRRRTSAHYSVGRLSCNGPDAVDSGVARLGAKNRIPLFRPARKYPESEFRDPGSRSPIPGTRF